MSLHCNHCNTDKLEADFSSSRRTICKVCDGNRFRIYRLKHLDKYRAYNRWYQSVNKQRIRELRDNGTYKYDTRKYLAVPVNLSKARAAKKRWKLENHEKALAAQAARRAAAKGLIPKSEMCQKCSRRVKLCAHHEDYAKPLEVIWLCYSCHRFVHGATHHRRKKLTLADFHA